MGKAAVDFRNLSKEERLQLLEEIWDSLESDTGFPVPESQRQELGARSRALMSGQLQTAPIADVLDAIRNRHASD